MSRSLTVLDWLRPELKRLDLALGDFPLSLVATETLRRISVLDRRRFNAIMPAASLGKLTYNDILREKDGLVLVQAERASSHGKDVDRMIKCILSFVRSVENAGPLEAIPGLDPQGTAIALPDRSFRAGRSKIAIFYPPSWGTSRTIADALCRVFASLCFYDRSYFVFDQAQHGDLVEEARGEVPADVSIKLVTIPLAAISASATLRAAAATAIRAEMTRSLLPDRTSS